MKRNFNDWMTTLKDSIADWNYYTDFDKVYKNVDSLKVELNLLNSLINSKNIEEEFRDLLSKYPDTLKAIPILLAKRESEIKITDTDGFRTYKFNKPNYTIDDYIVFMRKTGLFDLLENHLISDLTDYVKGVEVGLDTNARKNRTGTTMENLVESHLIRLGFVKGTNYFTQVQTKEIKKLFDIDLTGLNEEVTAEKRFDFVVKTDNIVYGIEVNFYSGGGSKLNETARSYKLISAETKDISRFKFMWITDGQGWFKAKNNLEETFMLLDELLNINDMENGMLEKFLK